MTYDLAFSLGATCQCSMSLRAAKLQFASFPFDWLTRGVVTVRANVIANRFEGWLEKDDFTYLGRHEANGLGRYRNKRTGILYLHDFADGPIENSYDAVREKYARRAARLLKLLGQSRRVLVLYLDSSRGIAELAATADGLAEAQRTLSKAFPDVAFDFVHFRHKPGVAREAATVERPFPWLVEVSFDYHDPVTDDRYGDVASVLRDVLGVQVRDYRTPAERRAFDRKRLEAKYGASSGLALAKARLGAVVSRLLARFTRR